MTASIKFVRQFALLVLVIAVASASAFAGKRSQLATVFNGPPVEVAVQNASFEAPAMTSGRWTFNEPVIGWTTLSASQVGTWNPAAGFFSGTPWDGAQVMYLNYGGVSQSLPVTLQPYTDYTVTVDWGVITTAATPTFSVQIYAAGKLLAACTPPFTPAPGKTATVSLVYHSIGVTKQVNQPISIRVLNTPSTTPYELYPSMATQVVDEVRVTTTDRNGTPGSAYTNKQECSYTFFQ